ncbi:MAG: TylF/MycF/NovP-related O-methyltransferase [Solirubrobacteraceae bacterium]
MPSLPPDSRLARLPRPLHGPASLLRNPRIRQLVGSVELGRRYSYRADGLATIHHCPFIDDLDFRRLYDEMYEKWIVNSAMRAQIDVRWRMWLLTRLARSVTHIDGNLAEFGSYRGGNAYMVLSTAPPRPNQRLFMFDTFSGIPPTSLTREEADRGFAGKYADTSVEHVTSFLAPWRDHIVPVAGDVFVTTDSVETGDLAFVHVDLNAAAPTTCGLEYAYPRLVPGAVVVFDDYTYAGYEEQRQAIDDFFSDKAEEVIGLPTGQGFVYRR